MKQAEAMEEKDPAETSEESIPFEKCFLNTREAEGSRKRFSKLLF